MWMRILAGVVVAVMTVISLIVIMYIVLDQIGTDHVTLVRHVTIQPGDLVRTGHVEKIWELRNDNRYFPLREPTISQRYTISEGRPIQPVARIAPRLIWPGETFQVTVKLILPPNRPDEHFVFFFTLQRHGKDLVPLPIDVWGRTYWLRSLPFLE